MLQIPAARAKLAQQVEQLHAVLSYFKSNSEPGKTKAEIGEYERANCEAELIKTP